MAITSQSFDMTSMSIFYVVLLLLSSLGTGPNFMSISSVLLELWQSFYKRLTKHLKIGNTSVWVLSNIWRLGQVRNTKFGTNVSNKMLLNAAKCRSYRFYRFWVIKEKPTGLLKLPHPHPSPKQIRVSKTYIVQR